MSHSTQPFPATSSSKCCSKNVTISKNSPNISTAVLCTFRNVSILGPDYVTYLLTCYETECSLRPSSRGLLVISRSKLNSRGDFWSLGPPTLERPAGRDQGKLQFPPLNLIQTHFFIFFLNDSKLARPCYCIVSTFLFRNEFLLFLVSVKHFLTK